MKTFHTIAEARELARRHLPRLVFDYIDGAAGEERAHGNNQLAFEAVSLLPRTLVNVAQRDLSIRCPIHCNDQTWNLPFGIAPMGMCNLVFPQADRVLAAAAAASGIPLGVSTAASSTLEQFAETAGPNAWFQLYVSRDISQGLTLVDRAEQAGYQVLMLTVDVPEVAPRPRDLRNGFTMPFRIGPRQFLDFAMHPTWSLNTLRHGRPTTANFSLDSTTGTFNRHDTRGIIDFSFLEQLRERWPGKLLVKGVLHAEDAVRMQQAGVDGIVISNHGGRQLDSAPATFDRLPVLRAAVGTEFPLLLDSGVTSGESIVKAYAAGASFVMLGRPFLYALGAAGAEGVTRLVELLANEVSLTLAQLGCTSIDRLDESFLLKEPAC